MYIHVYIHKYMYIYVYVYMYIYMRVHVYIYIYIYMVVICHSVCMYIYVNIHIHMYTYVHVYMYMYTCLCVYVYIHINMVDSCNSDPLASCHQQYTTHQPLIHERVRGRSAHDSSTTQWSMNSVSLVRSCRPLSHERVHGRFAHELSHDSVVVEWYIAGPLTNSLMMKWSMRGVSLHCLQLPCVQAPGSPIVTF